MDQTQLIKTLVKVLREDIKKTLKEEIRNAVYEVLNEETQPKQTKKINENYRPVSKDDGDWGEMRFSQKSVNPITPTISPDMLGYGDGFSEYSRPEGGMMNEEYSSYIESQEGGPNLNHKLAIAAQRNPQATQGIMKAMNRDYSALVKKFNKG